MKPNKLYASLVVASLLLVGCSNKDISPANNQEQPVTQKQNTNLINPVVDGLGGQNVQAPQSGSFSFSPEQKGQQPFMAGDDSLSRDVLQEIDKKYGNIGGGNSQLAGVSEDNLQNLTPEEKQLLNKINAASQGGVKEAGYQVPDVGNNTGLSTGMTDSIMNQIQNGGKTPMDKSGNMLQDKLDEMMQQGSMEGQGGDVNSNFMNSISKGDKQNQQAGKLPIEIIPENQIPNSLKGWVEQGKTKQQIFANELDGYYYILFSAGPQPQTGYQVQIVDAIQGIGGNKSEIHFMMSHNPQGAVKMTTYPYALVKTPKTNVDILFKGSF